MSQIYTGDKQGQEYKSQEGVFIAANENTGGKFTLSGHIHVRERFFLITVFTE
jgi:hypothetical protein